MYVHNPLNSSQPASSYGGTKLGGRLLREEQGPKRPGGRSSAFPLHETVSTPHGSNQLKEPREGNRETRKGVRVTSAVSRGSQVVRILGDPREAGTVCAMSPHLQM